MRRMVIFLALVVGFTLALTGVALAHTTKPEFKLGFKALADMIPEIVGQPLENEHYGPNGDSLQQTSTGLMVWRKADNWTAFTNGSRTWINGPEGLQDRDNNDRFPWEADGGPAASQGYSDPFSYCAAVGNTDSPGSDYIGPDIPQEAVSSMTTLFGEQEDYVSQFLSWRCYKRQPLVCLPGANLPCWKMDTSQTPNDGMNQFCQANPDSDFIPAVATGRDTVYSWRCVGTTPTIERQWVSVDDEGFGTNFWYQIIPSEYLQGTLEQVTVQTGDRFDIVLEANHTTGFEWSLSWLPNDSVVKLVGSTYRAGAMQPGAPPATGVGGVEIWTFEAVAPGHVSMGFDYRRPWESVQPAKRHAVAVTVDR